MRLTLLAFPMLVLALLSDKAIADEPVLHEPLPPVQGSRQRAPVVLYDGQGRDSALPQAIQVNGEILERPAFLSAAERAKITEEGRFRTATNALPDRRTEREEQLNYRTVFQPSILPFKRGMALAMIGTDGSLNVPDGPLREITPVGNAPTRGREMFWADLEVDLEAETPVAIPSVSPSSRVLSYETRPTTHLRFFKDAADNLHVSAARSGRIHLVMFTDAPQSWFGGSISEVPLSELPPVSNPVPASLRADTREAIKHLGIGPDDSFRRAMEKLVSHFRAFRSGKLEKATESPLLDVVLNQTGICRHRSHWFVVIARALGIEARYVHNEAHAFVEVKRHRPADSWLRIDLGGDAERLQAFGADGKVPHTPMVDDMFGRPPAYEEAGGRPAGARSTSGLPRQTDRSLARPAGRHQLSAEDRPVRPITPGTEHPHRVASRTSAHFSGESAFRGEPLAVSGTVATSAGEAIRHGRVQVVLRFHGEEETSLLGSANVSANGDYALEVQLPRTLRLGEHEIYVEFLGSQSFGPSRSP